MPVAIKLVIAGSMFMLHACSASMPQQEHDSGLVGTSWQLVKFVGGDDTTRVPGDPSRYFIQFNADGTVSARVDCNRGRGTWRSNGPGQIEFSELALTRATCPFGSLYKQWVKHWPYVRSYVVKDDHLMLSLMADGGIYEFEPANR
ncbi:MAG TPA: META domain-containing protein [Steroidobacter sp.]